MNKIQSIALGTVRAYKFAAPYLASFAASFVVKSYLTKSLAESLSNNSKLVRYGTNFGIGVISGWISTQVYRHAKNEAAKIDEVVTLFFEQRSDPNF